MGAVAGHTLKIVDAVVEDEAHLQGAHAALQPPDMAQLHPLQHGADDLLQGLHLPGQAGVLLLQRLLGQGDDLQHRAAGPGHVLQPVGGKGDALAVHLPGQLRQVHRMVGDALQVGEAVEVVGADQGFPLIEAAAVEMKQVIAQLVLIAVHRVFPAHDLLILLLAEAGEQLDGAAQVFHGGGGHALYGVAALLQRQGGIVQKALVQQVFLKLLVVLGGLLLDGEHRQLDQQPGDGQLHQGGGHLEYGVEYRDAEGGGGLGHKGHGHKGVDEVEGDHEQRGAHDVEV